LIDIEPQTQNADWESYESYRRFVLIGGSELLMKIDPAEEFGFHSGILCYRTTEEFL
jgi:hypothetical protein